MYSNPPYKAIRQCKNYSWTTTYILDSYFEEVQYIESKKKKKKKKLHFFRIFLC